MPRGSRRPTSPPSRVERGLFARVVVDVSTRSLDRPLTYAVPPELEGLVGPGSTVEVPLRHRQVAGFVVDLLDCPGPEAAGRRIRPVTRLLEAEPFWGRDLLETAEWVRRFYGCSWLEALQAAVPAPVLSRVRAAVVHSLRATREPPRDPPPPVYPAPALHPAQERALEAVRQAVREGGAVLLFGVTGSGKTEVYLRAVQEVLEAGRQAVVLVPELSLTPQAVERYRGRLGDVVALVHSGLQPARRRAEWWRLRRGEARVALGTRSAVFAPLADPALFVVDEEHESSYKQEHSPRYHARQVAFRRAAGGRAGVVLGSATPSVESYYLARRGRYRLVEMMERVGSGELPPVTLVDMRRHYRSGGRGLVSRELADRLREACRAGGQVVLLLNRRGFSSYLQCRECGHVPQCRHCSISLTYHRARSALRCHYCMWTLSAPEVCPVCQSPRFRYAGAGTQRLEAELAEILPGVPVLRMDRDTTGRAGSHAEILGRFGRGEARILVGTRMIAKGLDYPTVTLAGVLMADADLHMPDFRAGERTFQMITQMAGRAGRGGHPGEVVIQALEPGHPGLAAAGRHDYTTFYEQEVAIRRQAVYPPFCRLVRLLATAPQSAAAAEFLSRAARALRRSLRAAEVVGPAPCPLSRMRGRYRWHLLLKGASVQDLMEGVRKFLDRESRAPDLVVAADPDPQSLM